MVTLLFHKLPCKKFPTYTPFNFTQCLRKIRATELGYVGHWSDKAKAATSRLLPAETPAWLAATKNGRSVITHKSPPIFFLLRYGACLLELIRRLATTRENPWRPLVYVSRNIMSISQEYKRANSA